MREKITPIEMLGLKTNTEKDCESINDRIYVLGRILP
jgi:hypothetical protein